MREQTLEAAPVSVSVVMPCYNEAGIIEKVVKDCYAQIIGNIRDSEFVIIDDCSNDATPVILKRLEGEFPKLKILKTPKNSGHGRALRLGYESAVKECVFQVDSDDQFELREFWQLHSRIKNCDLVLGSRRQRNDPLHRLLLSRIISLANFSIFGVFIKDANCPFRLIRRQTLKSLLETIPPGVLAPNIFISILARIKKVRMCEVPISHRNRRTGKVSIVSWRLINFAFRGFKELLFWRIELTGKR